MQNDLEWLLEGEPWVEYNTRINLLHQPESNAEVQAARQAMTDAPQIKQIIKDLQVWPWKSLNNHKSAGHPIHLLTFLADIGLVYSDPGIENIINPILAHQSTEGPFQTLENIPTVFGGSGKDEFTWMLCDAPLLCYALAKFGLNNDPREIAAVKYLANLVRENGWPCSASKSLGKFHGPGNREDPCPFATLIMLKTLAVFPEQRSSSTCHAGVECLLDLWQHSREKHPYLFHMGTNFRKLKAPLVWFDIVHVLDVLSLFEQSHQDKRFQEMLDIVISKADDQRRYTPESIWTVWKSWDFGQKREPSRWLTYLIRQIICRVYSD